MSKMSEGAAGLWQSRWFLPGALGAVALSEWLLHRLLYPMVGALLGIGATATQVLSIASRFSLNLAAVLAVGVVPALLWRATEPGGTASNPLGRFFFLIIGGLLCLLAVPLVIAPEFLTVIIEARRAQWLVQLSGVCLAALAVLGLFPRYEPRALHKLGALLLLVPPIVQLETQWGILTNSRALQRYGLLAMLYGPVVAVASLGAGALCLSELPPGRRTRLPLFVSSVATLTMGFLLSRYPNLTTRMIYMSFDLRLPPHAEAYALYLLSLCAWSFAVTALLAAGTVQRVRGLGLMLIGLGGCQSRELYQMLFYLAGLLCVAESLLDRTRRARAQQSAAKSAPNMAV